MPHWRSHIGTDAALSDAGYGGAVCAAEEDGCAIGAKVQGSRFKVQGSTLTSGCIHFEFAFSPQNP
jgi:hypothetical protein